MKKYVFKKRIKRFLIYIFDVIGYMIFFPFKLFRKKIINPRKILVMRIDQIGDMVQALPFFDILNKKYKEALIYVLCTKQTEFLLKQRNDIKKIFTIENSWFYKEKKVNLKEIMLLIKELRKEKIDFAFDLRGDLRNILLLFFSGIKNIYGYGCAGGGFLLDIEKPYDREMHEIDKNLFLIDEKTGNEVNMNFNIPEKSKTGIENFLKENNIDETYKKIVIHPFSRAKAKLWDFKKFNDLINKIEKNHRVKIFIIGSKEEKIYSEKFIYNQNIIDCIGKFDIETVIELINKSDIFIGCDSSLQYFAAYLNKKTAVIYGYTVNNIRWRPKVKKENFIGFSKPVECGPCELDKCPEDKNHQCMEIITVDEVYEAIKVWLN